MMKISIYMMALVFLSFSCLAVDYSTLSPYISHKFDFRTNTNTTHIIDIFNATNSAPFTSLTWENNDSYAGIPYSLFANASKDMALVTLTSLGQDNTNMSIVICAKYNHASPPTGNASKVSLLGVTETNEFIVGARGHEAGVYADRTVFSNIPSWNLWACYFFTYDATGDMLQYYWNSSNYVYQRNKTNTNMYLKAGTTNKAALFGFYDSVSNLGGEYQWYGHINMFEVFNRTLKNDEIDFISRNPNWYFDGSAPSNPLVIQSIILKNENNTVYGSNFTAFDLFKISSNVTYNNVFNASLNCSYNTTNIRESFPFYGNNVSIYNTNYTANFTTYSSFNVNNDTVRIKLCKEQSGSQGANLYMNGQYVKNINESDIPLCSNGLHNEDASMNVTVITNPKLDITCSGVCNVGHTLRIVSFGRNTTSLLLREYNTHTEILYPNSTANTYDDIDYGTHFWQNNGTKYLTVSCNNSGAWNYSLTSSYTILPAIVSSGFSGVIYDNTTSSLVNGMMIPSSESYVFGGYCIGGGISLLTQMNLTYANNTLITSQNNGYLITNRSGMSSDGKYNLSLYCYTSSGSNATSKISFNISDSTAPAIFWITPDNTGTMETARYLSFPIEVVFSDVNLYRMNITCKNSYGIPVYNTGYIYSNDTIADLIGNSNNLSILGTVTCEACASDSHTKKKISDITTWNENGTQIFEEGDVQLKVTYEDNKIKNNLVLTRIKDRYQFEPVTKLEKNLMTQLNYEVECAGDVLRVIRTSEFYSHFVCGNFWIDFQMQGLSRKNYVNTPLVGERYKVALNLPAGGLSSLKTDSVGIINTFCDTAYFRVVESTSTTSSNTVNFDVLSFGLIIIWIVLFIVGFTLPAVGFFAVLWSMFLSFAVIMPYNSTLGFIFIFINIGYGYFIFKSV